MSEALERVIAQQQKEIDHLKRVNESLTKSAETVFTREEKLFETIARVTDYPLRASWKDDKAESWKEYHTMLNDLRTQAMDAGFCLHCERFICECED